MEQTEALPLVSILTPSYQHAPFLRDNIESVLAQDYPRIEHIVIDGGSTDGTVEILREYQERYPERFRWVSERDRGQADAFNKGLAMARGSIIGWQNSDDYYLRNTFREPLRLLAEHPDVAVVYGDCLVADLHGRPMHPLTFRPFDYGEMLEGCCVWNQAVFARRDVLLAEAGLQTELHFALDYDLWLRLGKKYRLQYQPGIRGAFRMLQGAKTAKGYHRLCEEVITVVTRALDSPELSEEVRRRGEAALHRHRAASFMASLMAGERRGAEALLAQQRLLDPALAHWQDLDRRWLEYRQGQEIMQLHRAWRPAPAGRFRALREAAGILAVNPAPDQDLLRQVDSALPAIIGYLDQSGLGGSAQARRLRALAHISQCLSAGPRRTLRGVAAHVIRAQRSYSGWRGYPGMRATMLRLLLGDRLIFTALALRLAARTWGQSNHRGQ